MKASPDYELKNKKEGPKSPKEANTMKPMTASIKKKNPKTYVQFYELFIIRRESDMFVRF